MRCGAVTTARAFRISISLSKMRKWQVGALIRLAHKNVGWPVWWEHRPVAGARLAPFAMV
jgi:hypothetical protein